MKSHDKWLDKDLKNLEKFTQLKEKKKDLKVLLGVGGWNDSRSAKYSRLVANPASRRTFANHALDFLLRYGFDGLDLDWEYPGYEEGSPRDKQGFTAWVKELKEVLAPQGLMLTSAVSASRRVIDRGYDIPRVAELLDLIFLMSYDFHGSWEKKVAHHSPLYPEPGQNPEFCSDFAVNYWIQKGAPPSKIVMGVPLYGRSWTLASSDNNSPGASALGPGRPGPHVKASGNLAFFECCLAFLKEGWSKVTGVGGPYITKDNQWVGYDDVEAVTQKAQYAIDEGLGGVMVWDLPSDDFGNLCGYGKNPLLTAIASTLKGTSTSPSSPSRPLGGDDADNLVEDNYISDRENGGENRSDRNLLYPWLAWPIFSQEQPSRPKQDSSIKPSQPSKPRQPSFSQPSTVHNKDNTTSSQLYPWLAWPIFSQGQPGSQTVKPSQPSKLRRPTTAALTQSGQGAKPPVSQPGQSSTNGEEENNTSNLLYPWLGWPIFSQGKPTTQNRKPSQPTMTTVSQSTQSTRPNIPQTIKPAKPTISQPAKPAISQPAKPTISQPSSSESGQGSTGGDKNNTTSSLLYPWLAWPIFSGSQPSSQKQDLTQKPHGPTVSHSTKPSTSLTHQSTTSTITQQHRTVTPTVTQHHQTPRPTFSQLHQPAKPATRQPVQTDRPQTSQGTGSTKGTTTSNLHYPWQTWPVFSQSPTASQRQGLSIKSSQSSVSQPGFSQQLQSSQEFQTDNQIKPSQPLVSKPFQSTSLITRPIVRLGRPGGPNVKRPTSPEWYSSCHVREYAPDPSSCNHFYRCTNGIAYRFDCPGGLVWHQSETSCDWPHAAPCPSL
ncbi:hypothetical protein Pcinc_004543 [Petrolisthes cinctipes]|uniref:Chitinase n=1 Tax=Petrolisthes cinctipes TaxID=88211 RepID=A0AAE1L3M1_PETCI|nr:hypothetical protein Pcinc_004543 [Petrolisthes cinctipes]